VTETERRRCRECGCTGEDACLVDPPAALLLDRPSESLIGGAVGG
jgi:hypothetical protein